jgi:hypothetical protein
MSRGVRRNALVKASERHPNGGRGVLGVNEKIPRGGSKKIENTSDLEERRPHFKPSLSLFGLQ